MDNKLKQQETIDLSEFFMTRSQANDFAVRLTTIIEQMYTTSFNFEKVVTTQLGIQKADMFLKLLRDHNLQTATLRQVQDFLKHMQEQIKNLSVVSLAVAFEPSDEVLKNISQWFIFNLKRQVLFDISVDPHLIAGIKITYNGKFKDYSVGQLFQQLVEKMLQPQLQEPITQPPLHQNSTDISLGR